MASNHDRRAEVLVTGVGLVAPLSWAEIADGRSALARIPRARSVGGQGGGASLPVDRAGLVGS